MSLWEIFLGLFFVKQESTNIPSTDVVEIPTLIEASVTTISIVMDLRDKCNELRPLEQFEHFTR